MSIIQSIRDKAAAIIFGAIAVSLIAFLLQDAFVGRGGRGNIISSLKDKVGSVNGEVVEYGDFNKKVLFYEDLQRRNNQPVTDESRQQLYDGVWEEFVTTKMMEPIFEKLGITVTNKEVNDQLYGSNPPPFIKQLFSDPQTGQYNAAAVKEFIKNIKKPKRNEEEAFYSNYIENSIQQQLINGGKQRKYLALLSGAAYYPKWLADKENADNSAAVNFSYVNIPYSSIPDSMVKVTDEEINAYVQKHKDEYRQEKSVELSYIVFDAAPTPGDSAKVLEDVAALKQKFAADTNAEAFLSLNNSAQSFFDGYAGKSKIQVPNKDSILQLARGQVFGPYLDVDQYKLAKMIDYKMMPDSVRAKHILIQTTSRDGQQSMTDSAAKKKIDSIVMAIQTGANFDTLAKKFSDDNKGPDGGSAAKGGDLGWFTQGTMVPEFNDFCVNGKVGERKVVKTQFGYHYVEITGQKAVEPFYKIAYYAQKISASSETSSKANSEATTFAAESGNSIKQFEENAKKKNLTTVPLSVTEKDYTLPGLGYGRKLVKWAFDNDKGEVSEIETFGDKYVVAIITDKKEEGTQNAKTARPLVESIVRNQKKAQQIIKQTGNSNDLNAIAAANKTTVQRADSITFQSPFIPNVGPESKLTGAAFAKQNLNKTSAPIAGTNGVFVIKTEQVFTKANPAIDYKVQRQQIENGLKNMFAYRSIEALKKAATIKDKRIRFY